MIGFCWFWVAGVTEDCGFIVVIRICRDIERVFNQSVLCDWVSMTIPHRIITLPVIPDTEDVAFVDNGDAGSCQGCSVRIYAIWIVESLNVINGC